MSVQHVDRLAAENKISRADDGLDVRTVCAYLRERKVASEEGSPKEELIKVQTRYRSLKADIAELEKQLKNGDALVTEQVVGEVNRALMSLRDSMMDAQRRLPEQCQGQDIRNMAATMEKEFRRILQDFHRLISSPLPEDWKAKYVLAFEVPK